MSVVVDHLGVRGAVPHVDTGDPPFVAPPDTIIDIPVPPSVNNSRRLNASAIPKVKAWQKQADLRLIESGQFRKATKMRGAFDLRVVLCERRCIADMDNILKAAIDYLRRIELIIDDNPKYMRSLHVVWGDAPQGCRLILRPSA